MTEILYGNMIALNFKANELTTHDYIYRLPTGYSVHQLHIISLNNVIMITTNMNLPTGTYVFPTINGKSPSTFSMYINDLSKPAYVRIAIEKFGQIPDSQYFDKAFEPILVTGEDGNDYPVIPSEQFK